MSGKPFAAGVGRLFGRGGPEQAELARRRLEETRRQLAAVTGAELEQARAALMHRWADWLANKLEEDPDAEGELRALIGQVQAQLVSAADHSAAVGRDMSIEASGGGVAAGVMHAAVVAGMGGTAIGRVDYQRPQVASLPVSLAPRPPPLAGREELLAELDAQLSAGDGRSPRIIVLCGLGVAGKTSVAVEYAHRHLAETGLVWQFPAEDPTVLLADFVRLVGLRVRRIRWRRGTRWRRCTQCWRPIRWHGWWCSITRRTERRWSGSCRQPAPRGC